MFSNRVRRSLAAATAVATLAAVTPAASAQDTSIAPVVQTSSHPVAIGISSVGSSVGIVAALAGVAGIADVYTVPAGTVPVGPWTDVLYQATPALARFLYEENAGNPLDGQFGGESLLNN